MRKLILEYIDRKGRHGICIGGVEFIEKTKKKCRQQIAELWVEHDEQRWEDIMDLTDNELLEVLQEFLYDHPGESMKYN